MAAAPPQSTDALPIQAHRRLPCASMPNQAAPCCAAATAGMSTGRTRYRLRKRLLGLQRQCPKIFREGQRAVGVGICLIELIGDGGHELLDVEGPVLVRIRMIEGLSGDAELRGLGPTD